MDYREKYKKHYGISFGDEYDVHHLDFNHQNDDMENLLLLPKRLHHQYHFAISKLPVENGKLALEVSIGGYDELTSFALSALVDLAQAMKECREWKDFKSHLDGNMPNIHGIYL